MNCWLSTLNHQPPYCFIRLSVVGFSGISLPSMIALQLVVIVAIASYSSKVVQGFVREASFEGNWVYAGACSGVVTPKAAALDSSASKFSRQKRDQDS